MRVRPFFVFRIGISDVYKMPVDVVSCPAVETRNPSALPGAPKNCEFCSAQRILDDVRLQIHFRGNAFVLQDNLFGIIRPLSGHDKIQKKVDLDKSLLKMFHGACKGERTL